MEGFWTVWKSMWKSIGFQTLPLHMKISINNVEDKYNTHTVQRQSHCLRNCTTRWWIQILFLFTPTWGRFRFWLIFFQMGWFNHQLENDLVFFYTAPWNVRWVRKNTFFWGFEGNLNETEKSPGPKKLKRGGGGGKGDGTLFLLFSFGWVARKGRGWGRKKTSKIFMFHIAGFRLLKCGNGIGKRMIES